MAGSVDFRRLFERGLEPLVLLDDAAVLITASDGYLHAIGRDRAEVVGRSIYDVPPYAGATSASRRLREALATVSETSATNHVVRLVDEVDEVAERAGPWAQATLWPIRDGDGRVQQFVHVLASTLGSHELQDALRHSAARLRIALEAAHAISWDGDLIAGRTRYSGDFAAFFGVPPGFDYEDPERALLAVHPDDRELVLSASEHCRQHGEPFKVEYRGLPSGEETRWFASHGRFTVDASGKPVRMLGVTWDVTERKLFEQRMQDSQKLESLGVLAGGIAHDFNNLLLVILGNVSLVRRELGPSHPSFIHIEHMEEASRRATELCRHLLAYAGKERFVLQRANLNQLIEDTTHLLQVSISKKALLRLELERELPDIVGDVTQLRQLLMNLVINASDALGEHNGAIEIATGVLHADRAYLDTTFLAPDIPAGEYVFLDVSDTGSGMSAETQARIFEPFFSTKFTGRGLGLAAVLGIVRGHRGALKVTSELGRGSSFRLLLPSAGAGGSEHAQPPQAQPLPHASGTILVVDDEASVRQVASQLLQSLGFRTLLAADGHEALVVFRAYREEIVGVLMDLTMPGLDGEETYGELQRIEPAVRVLLMSGYNEQDTAARFVGKGVAGFIQKPFSLEELAQRLRALIG